MKVITIRMMGPQSMVIQNFTFLKCIVVIPDVFWIKYLFGLQHGFVSVLQYTYRAGAEALCLSLVMSHLWWVNRWTRVSH